jgi:hypothetical protein
MPLVVSLADRATKGRSNTWMDTVTKGRSGTWFEKVEEVGMRRGTW